MFIRSLSQPEKLCDGKYGVLCMVSGKYGIYRKMVRFGRKYKATAFYESIPEEPLWV